MRPKLMHSALLAICSLALASCIESSDIAEPNTSAQPELQTSGLGSWHFRAPMPTARSDLAAAVVNASGRPVLYAIGGRGASGPLRHVEAYDYATDSWTRKADLPYAGAGSGQIGAVAIGGKIYVPGGYPDQRRLYVYNPGTNTWVTKAPLPISSSLGISATYDGKLYVLIGFALGGGYEDSSLGRRLYRYDPATNTWTRRADSPDYHADGIAGFAGGKLHVAGGWIPWVPGGYDDTPSRVVSVYDPATNGWTTHELGNQNQGGRCSAGVTFRSELYELGGAPISPDPLTTSGVMAYSPAMISWIRKAPMLASRCRAAAVRVVYEGVPRLLVLGGFKQEDYVSAKLLRSMEIYRP